AHVYLCAKEECSKKLEEYKTYPWYAGHKVVPARGFSETMFINPERD
ncbi:unnamed protein product, partial [marine sediment metagenome]